MSKNMDTGMNDICSEFKEMSVTGYFKYGLSERPETVFSDNSELIFNLSHNCECYADCQFMIRQMLYVIVKSEEKITYGKIFDEIEKQIKAQYSEISLVYGLSLEQMYCDHRVIRMFLISRKNQYDIVCGI